MKLEIKLNQKQSLKRKLVIGGSIVLISIVSVLVFNGQFFNSFKSKAAVENEMEMANEYWIIQSVNANFNTSIDIEIASKYNGELLVKLFSKDDKLLIKQAIKLEKGDNIHHLNNVGLLPAGKYKLEVSGEDKSIIKEISKLL